VTLPVTVVIPAYRCAGHVGEAVRSALGQRPEAPAEVIVVDDGSGDDTPDRAEQAGARVIRLEPNRGVHAARNAGLEAAAHDWVALLDCDDAWDDNHLDTLWNARDGHVLVSAAVRTFGGERRVMGWAGRDALVLRTPPDALLPENKVMTSAVLLRRDVALDLGGFRAGLAPSEDLDLWLRMLERGTGLALPVASVAYRRHPGQASGEGRAWATHAQVLEGLSDRPWCTPALRARHDGVVAWDSARAALRNGQPRLPALARLAAALAHPQRALGVAQMLRFRRDQRRMARRLTSA
jgi:GT2 family glycosyltransferase